MTKDKQKEKKPQMVSFLEMFKYSDLKVKIFLFIGISTAVLAGLTLPVFTIFIGDLYNSYDPAKESDDAYDDTTKYSLIFVGLGLLFWLFSYGFTAFFGMASEYTGVTFRIKYFESVLKQNISWFEDNDPQFLPTKISKEAGEIQSATSEKAANIFFGLTILFSGIIISFVLSWKFTLVC